MEKDYLLDQQYFDAIQDSCLFYPTSGADFDVPIHTFVPYVTDFHFVDVAYFAENHQDSRFNGQHIPADKQKPLLIDHPDFEFKNSNIDGPPNWNWRNKEIEACTLTETYLHKASDKIINIHRRRGYGFYALRNVMKEIGVFFYRGDSPGEGGSGNLWFNDEHMDELCDKLIDGALLVVDGSDGSMYKRGSHNTYYEFGKHTRIYKSGTKAPDVFGTYSTFYDQKGRKFTCVGYVDKDRKYNPTMIWQLTKYPD